jgi:nucleotide-binding universal stress UspA family protein
MPRKIMIANDGSDGGARALDFALAIARPLKAELHMICVEELPAFPTSVDEVIEEKVNANHAVEDLIGKAEAQARAHHLKLHSHVATGHAVPRIIEAVEQNGIDLLVVGYMGHTALYNRLIGSTTDRLVDLAPCSVVVVK